MYVRARDSEVLFHFLGMPNDFLSAYLYQFILSYVAISAQSLECYDNADDCNGGDSEAVL